MKSIEVINPATGEPFESCNCTTFDEFDSIVEKGAASVKDWGRDLEVRREALRNCAKAIGNRRTASDLAKLLTKEQGKPFKEAMGEVYGVSHWFAETAELEFDSSHFEESQNVSSVYEPLGVVAAITPWNFPLLLAAGKVAPALLAGNSVVLKPSPFTPLSTVKLHQILTELPISKSNETPALPSHVFQVVLGDGDLGKRMIGHPLVKKISFTGSTETGIAIAQQAAAELKSVTLELGGNDAAIVLKDVDIEQIAQKIFWGAFTNAGQYCVGIKRLYVHESRFDQLIENLVGIAESIKIGDGAETKTELGPIANKPQFERVANLVDDAILAGGKVCTGGKALNRPGYFFPPTIVTNLDDATPLVAQEQFGPALPVLRFSSEEEAISRANSTQFGLGNSVWGNNLRQATKVATRLSSGTRWVNQHGVLSPRIPFGGKKLSGVGFENGSHGLREFQQLSVINKA